MKDKKRSGGPVEVDDDQIKAIIVNDRQSSTGDIAKKLDVSHSCVVLGTKRTLSQGVPPNLGGGSVS